MDHLLASSAKGRRVGRQPSNDTSQFVRSANPAERVHTRPLIQQVRLRVQIRRSHPGRGKKKKRIWSAVHYHETSPAFTTAPQSRSRPRSTQRSRVHSLRSARRLLFFRVKSREKSVNTYEVYMCPGESVLTRIPLGPSSHAMLRAICNTADLLVLYDTHA